MGIGIVKPALVAKRISGHDEDTRQRRCSPAVRQGKPVVKAHHESAAGQVGVPFTQPLGEQLSTSPWERGGREREMEC